MAKKVRQTQVEVVREEDLKVGVCFQVNMTSGDVGFLKKEGIILPGRNRETELVLQIKECRADHKMSFICFDGGQRRVVKTGSRVAEIIRHKIR